MGEHRGYRAASPARPATVAPFRAFKATCRVDASRSTLRGFLAAAAWHMRTAHGGGDGVIGPDGYGDAELKIEYNAETGVGYPRVVRADDVIAVTIELLAQETGGRGLWIGGDGLLWLAGDADYRYRPVRFISHVSGLPVDCMAEGARLLVLERVR